MAAIETPRPSRRALLIASARYSDPGLASLRAPTGDVAAFAEVLADPAIGGFAVQEVIDQPTDTIKRRIEEFFRDSARNDVLLFYFSGHGVLSQDRRFYFATASTELEWVRTTAIDDRWVNEAMDASRARSIVLVLDCCHSGAFGKGLVPKSALGVDVEHRFDGHGRVTLTASSELEYAFEESDPATGINELDAAEPGSLFTRVLIEGLRTGEADTDDDGAISVDDLYDYARVRVRESSTHQTPRMSGEVSGDIVIAHSTRRVRLPPELDAAVRSNLAGIRLGAVSELAALLGSGAPGLAALARDTLEGLARDDSDSVKAAAREALGAPPAEPPPAAPPPPAEPPPAAPPPPADDSSGAGSPRRRRAVIAAAVAAGVAAVVTGAIVLFGGGGSDETFAPYDFNRDGSQQVVLGASGGSPAGGTERAGIVLVHPGPDNGKASPITSEAAGLGAGRRGDRYGASLASADFDADGEQDLAIGAPGREAVALLYGADSAPARQEPPLRPSVLAEPPPAGAFGFALAAGDLDRDGYGDLVVGTPGLPADRRNDVPGAVHVFFGSEVGLTPDRVRRLGAPTNEEVGFGRFLELGDVDRDGHLDLVEGTMGEPENELLGHIAYCKGSPDGPSSCEEFPDSGGWGTSALAIGNLNGDRFLEVVQGDQAPWDGENGREGEVRLWGADVDGPVAEPLIVDQVAAGLAVEEEIEFGHAVEAGDTDGDGLEDAIIGARYYGEAGAVVILHGARSIEGKARTLLLEHDTGRGEGFGETLAMLDLNGDQQRDLVVGVATPASLDNAAVVFMGAEGGLAPEAALGGMDGLAAIEESALRIGR
jgi:hypothetical protein